MPYETTPPAIFKHRVYKCLLHEITSRAWKTTIRHTTKTQLQSHCPPSPVVALLNAVLKWCHCWSAYVRGKFSSWGTTGERDFTKCNTPGSPSLLILEQHSTQQIRFEGCLQFMSSLGFQPGLGFYISVYSLIISLW